MLAFFFVLCRNTSKGTSSLTSIQMNITARMILPTTARHRAKLIGFVCFLILLLMMACCFFFFQDMCLVTPAPLLSSPSSSSSPTTSFLQSKTRHRNKEAQKDMMAALARQSSPSTLDTSDLLSFEVCGGAGGSGVVVRKVWPL